MQLLKLDDAFAERYVNEGFSGGEKKRLEMLQMAVLQPEMAILDETDSGSTSTRYVSSPRASTLSSPDLGALSPITSGAELHHARRRARTSGRSDHRLRRQGELALRPRPRATRRSCSRPASSQPTMTTPAQNRPSPGRGPHPEHGHRPRWTLRPSAPTSRFSSATSTAAGWLTLTRPLRRSSRASSPTRSTLPDRYSANIHRGVYQIAEEASGVRGRESRSRRSSTPPRRARS
jgi:hypothetical protein